MSLCRSIHLCLVSVALAAGVLMAPAASAGTLRVCSDPDNLPFSNAAGPEHGLYIDLANLVAQKLGDQVAYTWWNSMYQDKALRYTILARKCDADFVLPAGADYEMPHGLMRTKGFLSVSYAVVANPSFTFTSLADLKGKRIGVQFSTTPQVILAADGGYNTTTYRTAQEMFAALDKGEIDIGFLWGPTAGYENKTHQQSRWRLTPLSGDHLNGEVAIAVRSSEPELAAKIDQVLTQLQPEIASLAAKYGFPQGKPVAVSTVSDPKQAVASSAANDSPPPATLPAAAIRKVGYVVPQGIQVAQASTDATAPSSKLSADAAAGRTLFNETCAHCHSHDGASPIAARDEHKLKGFYGDNWPNIARTTIENGRPDKGMPTWKGILTDKQIDQIIAFFGTIQDDQ